MNAFSRSRTRNKSLKFVFLVTVLLVIVVSAGLGVFAYIHHKNEVGPCTNKCNVLLISVDSLRADHVGAYGYSRNTTPNFDALAKQGSLFLNYFSTSYLTPVSEASVQTGLYPSSNGIINFDSSLPSNRQTTAQYLDQYGYHSEAIVSSPEFLTFPTLKDSFSRGFESYQYVPTDGTNADSSTNRAFPPISTVASELEKGKTQKNFLWLALGGVHWPYGEDAPNIYANP